MDGSVEENGPKVKIWEEILLRHTPPPYRDQTLYDQAPRSSSRPHLRILISQVWRTVVGVVPPVIVVIGS